MYHLFKSFAESEDEITERLKTYADEPHGVVIPYTTVLWLSPSFFRDELELGLHICGCDNFLGYSAVMEFDALVLNPLTDLLEEYAKADSVGARIAAEEMIRILEHVDTDDDTFPESEIAIILQSCGIEGEY